MSKFKIWIDDNKVLPGDAGNVLASDVLDSDVQRINGFKSGTDVSSKRVNSILRQNSLVSKALMDLSGNDTFDYNSTLENIKSAIKNLSNYTVNFTQASTLDNITSGEQLNTTLGKISKQLDALSGFMKEEEGNVNLYASNDTSKGTIEQRLTNLGFKEGSIELASGYTAVTNKLKRQGNYVIGELIFNPDAYKLTYTLTSVNVYTTSNQFLIGKIPIGFRPKNGQNCGIDCWIEFPGFSLSLSNIILKTGAYATITSDGFVYMYLYGYKNFNTNITIRVDHNKSCRINFGYEAKPLT